jgi:RNA polymerase sigma-B factor
MRRHRAGDPRARETLIERYLPLARGLALRYRRNAEPVEDLVQIASLGLVKAVDRWEPERGLAFSSFAMPTILGELRRYFRDATWVVRPPRELQELTLKIERARDPLSTTIGREPGPGDFAEHLGRSPEVVAEALQAAGCRWASSLDSQSVEHPAETATVGETIGSDERGYEQVESRATFERLTSVLDQRAREILRLRFDDDLLQTEIAGRVGCSQMQVSRIIRTSLEQLTV